VSEAKEAPEGSEDLSANWSNIWVNEKKMYVQVYWPKKSAKGSRVFQVHADLCKGEIT
jgi:hypothetical protein